MQPEICASRNSIPEKKSCLASHVLGVLAVALLCTALVGTSAFAAFLSAGNHAITVNRPDGERSAIVHVPAGAVEKRELAVILNFHGGGGTVPTNRSIL